jgi:hypothetical protein
MCLEGWGTHAGVDLCKEAVKFGFELPPRFFTLQNQIPHLGPRQLIGIGVTKLKMVQSTILPRPERQSPPAAQAAG